MAARSSENTTAVTMTTESGEDYLFTSLHGYNVTLSDLLISIVIVILGILIIVLNCLLIHTLIRCRAQLDVTDGLINSLAVIDALTGVFLLYNSAYNIGNFQNLYECYIRFGIIIALSLNSTGHISLLTINRYIKITRPFKYHEIFNKKRIFISSMAVWCFSLLIGCLPLMGWNREFTPAQDESKHLVCRYFGIMDRHYITLNFTLNWVPLVVMVITYTHICKIAYHHSKIIDKQENVTSGRRKPRMFDSRSWRFTKTVFIIIGAYFFCWMPTGVYFMIQQTGNVDHLSLTEQGNILVYTTGIGFINSLVNPLIYATKIQCVKQRFKRIFCCMFSRQRSPQASRVAVTNNFHSSPSKRNSQGQVESCIKEENGNINYAYSQTSLNVSTDNGA